MELANCILALGGDRQNTVPKFGVTPAEIAVLMAIHGDDAVFDIEPTGDVSSRRSSEEIERLVANYPAKDESGKLIVESIYPGRQPILHKTFADLDLAPELFATTSRASAPVEENEPGSDSAPISTPRAEAKAPKVPNSADDLFADDEAGTADPLK